MSACLAPVDCFASNVVVMQPFKRPHIFKCRYCARVFTGREEINAKGMYIWFPSRHVQRPGFDCPGVKLEALITDRSEFEALVSRRRPNEDEQIMAIQDSEDRKLARLASELRRTASSPEGFLNGMILEVIKSYRRRLEGEDDLNDIWL